MKRFIAVLLILLLCASGFVWTGVHMYQDSISSVIMSPGEGSYVEEFKEVTVLTPVYETVPVEFHEALDEVIAKNSNDKKLDNIIQGQVNMVLGDIANGTVSFNQYKAVNELLNLVDDYSAEIEKATGQAVPKEQIRTEMEQRIKSYDLVTQYESVMTYVEGQLSPSQKQLLVQVNQFNESVSTIKLVSASLFIISTIILFVLKPRWILPVGIFGLVLLTVFYFSLPALSKGVNDKVAGRAPEITLSTKIFKQAYLYLGGFIVVGIIPRAYRSLMNKVTIED